MLLAAAKGVLNLPVQNRFRAAALRTRILEISFYCVDTEGIRRALFIPSNFFWMPHKILERRIRQVAARCLQIDRQTLVDCRLHFDSRRDPKNDRKTVSGRNGLSLN